MFKWWNSHPPNPGISPSHTIAAHASRVLDGIKADTDYVSHTTNSETSSTCLRRLSEESMLIWGEIESLAQSAPAELLCIWNRLEEYQNLLHDIRDAISSNAMTDDKANDFIRHLSDFVHKFKKHAQNGTIGSPSTRRSDLTSSAKGIIQDVGNVAIFGGSFVSNNVHQTTDPSLSDQLKQIKKILFVNSAVLFGYEMTPWWCIWQEEATVDPSVASPCQMHHQGVIVTPPF